MAGGDTLGDLLRRAGLPVGTAEPAASATPQPIPEAEQLDLAACGKLVIRRERKGRGGKTATIVEGVTPEMRQSTARTLRRALGCGATVDGEAIVIQGDLGQRVARWLAGHGARRIVIGS